MCVRCQVSGVRCQVSGVTCHMSLFFFGQICEACRGRVCYQRGLPRLLFGSLGLTVGYLNVGHYRLNYAHSKNFKPGNFLTQSVCAQLPPACIIAARPDSWSYDKCTETNVQYTAPFNEWCTVLRRALGWGKPCAVQSFDLYKYIICPPERDAVDWAPIACIPQYVMHYIHIIKDVFV